MSAIFGLYYVDGRPVAPESLGLMRSVMSAWGPDGCTQWQQGNAGLGHALLLVSPNSQYETMPLHDPETKQVLVAAARLDNRDELFDRFDIPYSERPRTPDGRLVQVAWRRWGESCPRRLYGDWSLAVWDYGRQRLCLARDQLGNTGLFYYHRPPFFAFASNLNALLAVPEVPRRLDEGQLAGYLTIFGEDYGADTIWQGIRKLLPGSRATVTAEGCRVDAYWRLEEAPPVRLGSDQAYLEGFLEQYRRAVQCRLDSLGPLGAELSSGLDSGSVTTLAAEALHRQGKKLTAFTSTPLYPTGAMTPDGSGDEWPLARSLAQRWDNLEHVPIRAESISPLTGTARTIEIYPEPVLGFANMFWSLALYDEVARRGIRVILTGALGNGSVSWTGGRDRIFYHLIQGDWQSARQALVEWKAKQGCSWWATLRRHLVSPILRPWWYRRHLLTRPWTPPWEEYSPIGAEFAHRQQLRQKMRARGHDPYFVKPVPPERQRFETLWLNGVTSGAFQHAVGSALHQEIRDPTADVRLVEFCLGVPGDQYTCQGGERMLLRRSFTGLMPPETLWSRHKGRQAADLALRLLASRDEVEAQLARMKRLPAAGEFLDLAALTKAWRAIQKQQTMQTTNLAAGVFMRGLGVGMLLEKL